MPIAKNLNKVSKSIEKSKTVLHPKGRKLKQLNRANLRNGKLLAKKSSRLNLKQSLIHRLDYIKNELNSNKLYSKKDILTHEEANALILNYINRNLTELNDLKKNRRPGRPISNRQNLLQNLLDSELTEFNKNGFHFPDLSLASNLVYIRNWNGTLGATTILNF
ncbi:Tma16p ASCRUDRAFT_23111, partial [Ascoidea rubescens DSM 1968]